MRKNATPSFLAVIAYYLVALFLAVFVLTHVIAADSAPFIEIKKAAYERLAGEK